MLSPYTPTLPGFPPHYPSETRCQYSTFGLPGYWRGFSKGYRALPDAVVTPKRPSIEVFPRSLPPGHSTPPFMKDQAGVRGPIVLVEGGLTCPFCCPPTGGYPIFTLRPEEFSFGGDNFLRPPFFFGFFSVAAFFFQAQRRFKNPISKSSTILCCFGSRRYMLFLVSLVFFLAFF